VNTLTHQNFRAKLAEPRVDMKEISDKLEETREATREIADIRTEINGDWKDFTRSRKAFIRAMDATLSGTKVSTEVSKVSDNREENV
jgi:uncharacterized membrane protein